MSKPKKITDIRFVESDIENVDGTSPKDLGQLVTDPGTAHQSIGKRLALMLHELGFVTGEFDRLFINLTSVTSLGSICLAERTYKGVFAKIRYFDFGVDFSAINSMSAVECDEWFAQTAFTILRFIAQNDGTNLSLLEQVESLHREYGERLQITHKTKSTKTYQVTVSYEVASHPNPSSAWVRHVDKTSGELRVGKILDLDVYTDVFFLVGSIAVKQGKVILQPRKSSETSAWTQGYETPIVVPIESLAVKAG